MHGGVARMVGMLSSFCGSNYLQTGALSSFLERRYLQKGSETRRSLLSSGNYSLPTGMTIDDIDRYHPYAPVDSIDSQDERVIRSFRAIEMAKHKSEMYYDCTVISAMPIWIVLTFGFIFLHPIPVIGLLILFSAPLSSAVFDWYTNAKAKKEIKTLWLDNDRKYEVQRLFKEDPRKFSPDFVTKLIK